jgi:hypothetical protein
MTGAENAEANQPTQGRKFYLVGGGRLGFVPALRALLLTARATAPPFWLPCTGVLELPLLALVFALGILMVDVLAPTGAACLTVLCLRGGGTFVALTPMLSA